MQEKRLRYCLNVNQRCSSQARSQRDDGPIVCLLLRRIGAIEPYGAIGWSQNLSSRGMMGSGDDCNYIRDEASRVQCNGGDHYDYRSRLEGPAKVRHWGAASFLGISSCANPWTLDLDGFSKMVRILLQVVRRSNGLARMK